MSSRPVGEMYRILNICAREKGESCCTKTSCYFSRNDMNTYSKHWFEKPLSFPLLKIDFTFNLKCKTPVFWNMNNFSQYTICIIHLCTPGHFIIRSLSWSDDWMKNTHLHFWNWFHFQPEIRNTSFSWKYLLTSIFSTPGPYAFIVAVVCSNPNTWVTPGKWVQIANDKLVCASIINCHQPSTIL